MAIAWGGPGALFWLWIASLLAMAVKLAETTLATRFSLTAPRGRQGGSAEIVRRGMSRRLAWLAPLFAAATGLAALCWGNMIPAQTAASQVRSTVHRELGLELPLWVIAAALALAVAVVARGKVSSLGRVAARVVPLIALCYLVGALVVIALHLDQLPATVQLVIDSAFGGTAAAGGFAGATVAQALQWGLTQGIVASQAGWGSSAIAHSRAHTERPAAQGLLAMLEPCIGGFCLATVTALAILTTHSWTTKSVDSIPLQEATFYGRAVTNAEEATDETNLFNGVLRVRQGTPVGTIFFYERRATVEGVTFHLDQGPFDGALLIQQGRLADGHCTAQGKLGSCTPRQLSHVRLQGTMLHEGSGLTAAAWATGFPSGSWVVSLLLVLFAWLTAIVWHSYGSYGVTALFGDRGQRFFTVIFVGLHFVGAIWASPWLWSLAYVAALAMALPTVLSLWTLAPLVSRPLHDELAGRAQRHRPQGR
jgi:AGCS family alanine or glycine:cation symporter